MVKREQGASCQQHPTKGEGQNGNKFHIILNSNNFHIISEGNNFHIWIIEALIFHINLSLDLANC